MNQKRNQTKVVNVFTVFMVMLILYFIVGLFTVINQQFQIPLQTAMLPHDGNITNALVTMLNFSWFLAYPLSEGFGTRWLEKILIPKNILSCLTDTYRRTGDLRSSCAFPYIYAHAGLHHRKSHFCRLFHFSDRLFCDRCSRNDPASSAQSISHSLPDW